MVPGPRVRIGLSRFMRDCSARGIAPECVTDATVADFLGAVAAGSLKTERQLRDLAREIPRLWNEARLACLAWPLQAIAIPDRRRHSRFKQNLASLPGTLSADLDEWLGWCAVPGPLDADARHRRLAPRTIALRLEQVLAAVTAALDEGIPADRLTSLSNLVEIDVFKAILTRLHRTAGGKPNAQAQGVSLTLVSLAIEWAKVSPEHLQELKRLRAHLPTLPKGLVAKNRELLRRYWRPLIPGSAGHHGLWASNKQCPVTKCGLNDIVTRHTRRELSTAVNLHRFRHAAATTIAIHDSATMPIAKDLLHHKDEANVGRHYNLAASLEASRSYARLLQGLRK